MLLTHLCVVHTSRWADPIILSISSMYSSADGSPLPNLFIISRHSAGAEDVRIALACIASSMMPCIWPEVIMSWDVNCEWRIMMIKTREMLLNTVTEVSPDCFSLHISAWAPSIASTSVCPLFLSPQLWFAHIPLLLSDMPYPLTSGI